MGSAGSGHADRVRRRVVVTGRVQGVGFRAATARQAVATGLAGFARNQLDGSVVVELEGIPAAVDAIVAWCRTGPRHAEVLDVAVEDVPTVGATTFEVGW